MVTQRMVGDRAGSTQGLSDEKVEMELWLVGPTEAILEKPGHNT